jgi:hypothetical protein
MFFLSVPRASFSSVGSVDGEYLQALQGFLLVVSSDGDLVFLSENVNEHLGISQVNLIFEFQ